ncbi:MAG: hypothetical protein LUF29_05215 [Oscillospiraceae bacterium]|nr:hypothetical protein [Oscillospiraceae bacterium]
MSKVKIKTCQYCGSVLQENGVCRACGNTAFFGIGCFYYGMRKSKGYNNTELVLTSNCYLIAKKGSNGAGTGVGMASFGVLGAVVGGLADSAVSSLSPHGFYDLTEVSVVQHPYPLKGKKPERVFRFICHDGRDFVLSFGKKSAMQFEVALSQLGIYMTDMKNEPATKICCQNPLVDKKTFDKHVCASMANRIELKNGQFPTSPILQR